MSETDNLYSIALEGIGRHAKWLAYSSGEVVHFVQLLNSQRPYPTEAEEQMELAEKALIEALEKLRAAKEAFQALPNRNP